MFLCRCAGINTIVRKVPTSYWWHNIKVKLRHVPGNLLHRLLRGIIPFIRLFYSCSIDNIHHQDTSFDNVMFRYTSLQVSHLLSPVRRRIPLRTFTTLHGLGKDEAELKAAREWLSKFDLDTIPRSICEVSFSRSSGPGGQNVNKYYISFLLGFSHIDMLIPSKESTQKPL